MDKSILDQFEGLQVVAMTPQQFYLDSLVMGLMGDRTEARLDRNKIIPKLFTHEIKTEVDPKTDEFVIRLVERGEDAKRATDELFAKLKEGGQ